MIYLLAKFSILFLLAAGCGFLLGRWWVRRSFVDVTESYETISNAASDAPWHKLWSRLDSVEQGMQQFVRKEFQTLPRPEIPVVDLHPLQQGIAHLDARVAAMAAPTQPEPTDLTPINERMERLERLIQNLPKPEKAERVDLNPLKQRIADLDARIAAIPVPAIPEPLNLDPLVQRVEGIEAALRGIKIPPTIELGPVSDRLRIIESSISQLAKRPELTNAPPAPRGPRLLKSATHGRKDDLKRIVGVGPKLERMLNEQGIYYFWQIAEWTAADIKVVDELLDVFKGRIARDKWVSQAKSLKRTSASSVTEPSSEMAAAAT